MGPVDLYPVSFTKNDLVDAPHDEVLFFLLAGHVHNELHVLLRVLLLSTPADGAPKPLEAAQTVTGHLMMRLLGAKLFEAWELLRYRFQGLLVSYGEQLPPDTA